MVQVRQCLGPAHTCTSLPSCDIADNHRIFDLIFKPASNLLIQWMRSFCCQVFLLECEGVPIGSVCVSGLHWSSNQVFLPLLSKELLKHWRGKCSSLPIWMGRSNYIKHLWKWWWIIVEEWMTSQNCMKDLPSKIPPSDALLRTSSSSLCYGSNGATTVEATLMFYYRAAQQKPSIINPNKTNMCLKMIHLINGIWSITTSDNNNNNNNTVI